MQLHMATTRPAFIMGGASLTLHSCSECFHALCHAIICTSADWMIASGKVCVQCNTTSLEPG